MALPGSAGFRSVVKIRLGGDVAAMPSHEREHGESKARDGETSSATDERKYEPGSERQPQDAEYRCVSTLEHTELQRNEEKCEIEELGPRFDHEDPRSRHDDVNGAEQPEQLEHQQRLCADLHRGHYREPNRRIVKNDQQL